MNIDVLREEIAADEGVHKNIQRSTLDTYLGIGHLKKTDIEHGLRYTDRRRVNTFLQKILIFCLIAEVD